MINRLRQMRSMLRVDVVDPLMVAKCQRYEKGRNGMRTTYFQPLQSALTPTEEILIGKKIVLPLISSSEMQHFVNHLSKAKNQELMHEL